MKKLFILIFPICILNFACNPNYGHSPETDTNAPNEPKTEQPKKVTLIKMTDSPKFPNAMLKRVGQTVDPNDKNKITFKFEVNNYEFKQQTSDAANKGIANSDKGQHFHFILNDEPYHAEYDPEFTMNLDDGHYVAVAFLARSYHESVKNANACQVWQFDVGEGSSESTDLSKPILFYSRPKGTYTGDDTRKVLLDFYLSNVTLSQNGYKVRATIDGKEFTLTKWVPYLMEGLPMGENTVKLELLDKNGNLVDSPFNPVERAFTLKEQGNA